MIKHVVKISSYDFLQWQIADDYIPALVTFLDSIGDLSSNNTIVTRKKKHKNKLLKSKDKFIKN